MPEDTSGDAGKKVAPLPADQQQRCHKSGPLRRHRGQRHPLDIHAKADHKQDVQPEIEDVDEDNLDKHQLHMLAPEQAAQKHHIGKRRRHCQNPDADIFPHQPFYSRAGGQQRAGQPQHERGRQHQPGPESERQDKPAYKLVLDVGGGTATMRLRHQPGSGHAQKAEPGIDEIEDKAAERDAADIAGVIKPAHHRRIRCADKRDGDVRQEYGPGNRPDIAPACLVLPAAACRICQKGSCHGGGLS